LYSSNTFIHFIHIDKKSKLTFPEIKIQNTYNTNTKYLEYLTNTIRVVFIK